MCVDRAGCALERFWAPDLTKTIHYTHDADYVEHYLELFGDTVRRLSRSHVPLACEVSGGLDSSAIFAVANSLGHGGELLAPQLQGFTLDFSDDPDADELAYCRAVGKHLNKQIHEVAPHYEPLSWYREVAQSGANWPGAPNGVMSRGLHRAARDLGCRVLLNGSGGDEWLGAGRNFYCDEMAAGRWSVLSALLRQDVRTSGWLRTSWWLLRYGILPWMPAGFKSALSGLRTRYIDAFDTSAWMQQPLRRRLARSRQAHSRIAPTSVRWPGQLGELGMLEDAYAILAHETQERLCATAGLEVRRPFWNRKMVQFSFSVPKRVLFHGGVNRHLHRQAMTGLLPETVIQRQSKAEFSVTFREFLTELDHSLGSEIIRRRADWVDIPAAEIIMRKRNEERYAGWADTMLWMLFSCDAMFLPAGIEP